MSKSQAANLVVDGVPGGGEAGAAGESYHPGQLSGTPTGGSFRSFDPRRKSPFIAGLLSLMPGLGQVYLGYYRRGFTNVLVVGSVFSFLIWTEGSTAINPLGILFLIFFVLYNIIDAARRASLYNLSLDGVEQVELPDPLSDSPIAGLTGSFVGGGALLLFGLIALSNTALGLSLEWLEDWWPLVPTAFGAYLVYKAYQDSQDGSDSDDGAPADAER